MASWTSPKKSHVVLSDELRLLLETEIRRQKASPNKATRYHIILHCADGQSNEEVAHKVGVHPTTVGRWRRRFLKDGVEGLSSKPRPKRPSKHRQKSVEIITPKDASVKSVDVSSDPPLYKHIFDKVDNSCTHPQNIDTGLLMGAYEVVCKNEKRVSFNRIAERYESYIHELGNGERSPNDANDARIEVEKYFKNHSVCSPRICVHRRCDCFPKGILEVKHSKSKLPGILYYQGDLSLANKPEHCFSVIGSRNASKLGMDTAGRVARALASAGKVVVSGLAEGIDSAALRTVIDSNAKAIAVIGTPIGMYYPKKNMSLQNEIAKDHLLISQVPILKYMKQQWYENRYFFPERNATMSAISAASIIIEAGFGSGAIVQARHAQKQGRNVYFMEALVKDGDRLVNEIKAIPIKDEDDLLTKIDKHSE